MPTNDYANAGDQSRAERILSSIINDTEYDEPVQSRLEYLLKQLKDLIATLRQAVVLRGETITPITDNATTNPIMIDGQSYTAITNDAVIYQSGEFIFDGTKWHALGDLSNLTAANIGAMTGYSKPNETSAIAIADTLNQAIGKLEKALDLNWTLGKGTSIPNNSDLNNYTSIGNYYHSGNPVNNGLINLPTQSGVAFRLTVYLSNGTDRPAQIYEESATAKKWKRYNNAQGVWGQWVLTGDNIATMQTNISTEQGKTTGMTEGGTDYITVNGIRFYVSSTTPTGTIPVGSIGVGF